MSASVPPTIAAGLAGVFSPRSARKGAGWRVKSTDAEGQPFTTSVAYRTRQDADDYADELRRKGREAQVIRA